MSTRNENQRCGRGWEEAAERRSAWGYISAFRELLIVPADITAPGQDKELLSPLNSPLEKPLSVCLSALGSFYSLQIISAPPSAFSPFNGFGVCFWEERQAFKKINVERKKSLSTHSEEEQGGQAAQVRQSDRGGRRGWSTQPGTFCSPVPCSLLLSDFYLPCTYSRSSARPLSTQQEPVLQQHETIRK